MENGARARTALIEGERRLTWQEFERQTARAANGLGALGLEAGDRVAVLMDNSLEMLVLLFGILRLVRGGAAECLHRRQRSGRHDPGRGGSRRIRLKPAPQPHRGVGRAIRGGGAHRAGRAGPSRRRLASTTMTGLARSRPGGGPAVRPDQECNIIYSSGTTGCRRASCIPMAAECTGRSISRWRCAIAATA